MRKVAVVGCGAYMDSGYGCLANAKPDCPYGTAEELAKMLEGKTGIQVVIGTHDYH